MKTATVQELRRCFGKISKWLEAGETVQILKNGRPLAKIVPEVSRPKTLLGACPSSVPLPDDIDDPVGVEWDAMK